MRTPGIIYSHISSSPKLHPYSSHTKDAPPQDPLHQNQESRSPDPQKTPTPDQDALEKPPSIIKSFPFALIGDSPSFTLTGICPFII